MSQLNSFRVILDYWWLVPLVALAAGAYRLFGWRGLVAVATLGAAGGIYTKGRTDQRAEADRAAQKARAEALAKRGKIDAEISNLSPDARADRLAKWMRDD